MTKRVLLTGAGGFIGSHTLQHILANTDWDVVVIDSFRHKGKTDRITQTLSAEVYGIEGPSWPQRVRVITHDLCAPISWQMQERIGHIDYVIAMASESHVDRSISHPGGFIRNNIDVAVNTLDFALHARSNGMISIPAEHVILISTDEVYGPVDPGSDGHKEWAPIAPSNPYSASKASQEAIAFSYWRTYGLPVTIVNCMNLIGEMQDPEKYVPMLISRISKGEVATIHGMPDNIGSRHYLHSRNLADALVYILREPHMAPHQFSDGFTRPSRYNIASPDRLDNLELARMVARFVGKDLHYEFVDFHSTRPGHDPHYGLNPGKLTRCGWTIPIPFADSLERTVKWSLSHPEWLAG